MASADVSPWFTNQSQVVSQGWMLWSSDAAHTRRHRPPRHNIWPLEIVIRPLLGGLYQVVTTHQWIFSSKSPLGCLYADERSAQTLTYAKMVIRISYAIFMLHGVVCSLHAAVFCVLLTSNVILRGKMRTCQGQTDCIHSGTAESGDYRSTVS